MSHDLDPQRDDAGSGDAGSEHAGRDLATADPAGERPAIVDWGRTGRRMAISVAVINAVVLMSWLALSVVDGNLRGRLLGELIGLGVIAVFVAEFVIVGGAALRGMLRAGDRGERLSGSDVSLLPPQVLRRRRR